jgi:hypothetical protein
MYVTQVSFSYAGINMKRKSCKNFISYDEINMKYFNPFTAMSILYALMIQATVTGSVHFYRKHEDYLKCRIGSPCIRDLLGCNAMQSGRIPSALEEHTPCCFLPWFTLCLWRWRQYVPTKHWCISTRLHGVILQNDTILYLKWFLLPPWVTMWCHIYPDPSAFFTDSKMRIIDN